jgi:hypothetical protein
VRTPALFHDSTGDCGVLPAIIADSAPRGPENAFCKVTL